MYARAPLVHPRVKTTFTLTSCWDPAKHRQQAEGTHAVHFSCFKTSLTLPIPLNFYFYLNIILEYSQNCVASASSTMTSFGARLDPKGKPPPHMESARVNLHGLPRLHKIIRDVGRNAAPKTVSFCTTNYLNLRSTFYCIETLNL